MKRLFTFLVLCSALARGQDSVQCVSDSILDVIRDLDVGKSLRNDITSTTWVKMATLLAKTVDAPEPHATSRPNGLKFTDLDSMIYSSTGYWNDTVTSDGTPQYKNYAVYGSASEYYWAQSGGRLKLWGSVTNPHNADSTYQFISLPDSAKNYESVVNEVVKKADTLGYIDDTYNIFILVLTGNAGSDWSELDGAAFTTLVYWHSRTIPVVVMTSLYFPLVGDSINPGRTDINTVCHELGHAVCWWRDEYTHTPNAFGFDIMAGTGVTGCPPFANPGDRIQMGWITPTIITPGQQYTVNGDYPVSEFHQDKENPTGIYNGTYVNESDDSTAYTILEHQLGDGFNRFTATPYGGSRFIIWRYYRGSNLLDRITTATVVSSDYVDSATGLHLSGLHVSTNYTTIDAVTIVPVSVYTNDATNIGPFTATLNGAVYTVSSVPDGIWFAYGDQSGTYTDTICAEQAYISGYYPVSADIENLTAGTTYYYRTEGIIGDSLHVGVEESFTTIGQGTPPTATTLSVTTYGSTTATLRVLVNPGTDSTKIWFRTGTTSGVYTRTDSVTAKVYGSGDMIVTLPITGLVQGTTYYVKGMARNSWGTVDGGEVSFTTSLPLAPTATLYNATFGTTTASFSAVIQWGGWTGSVAGYYGTDSLPSTFISILYNYYSYSANLSGLTAATKYYYAVRLKWNSNLDSSWTVKSFTTLSDLPAAPTATTTDPPDSIGISSAKFLGTITSTVPATIWFAYKKTSASTWDTVTVTGTDSGTGKSVYYWKYGLDIATEYQYKCGATQAGGTGVGDAVTFSTLTTSPTVVMGAARRLSVSSVALSGTVNANGLTTTPYFLYGTRHIYTDSSASHPVTVSGTTTTTIRDTIGSLQLDSTYYVIIGAKNSDDQYVRSNEVSFLVVSTPTVSADSSGTITQTSAIIYGHGNPHGLPTTFSFVWYSSGRSQSGSKVFNQVNFSSPHDTAFSYSLTGLSPDTTYSFYLSGRNTLGTIQDTSDFTTLGVGQTTSIPALRNLIADAITETTATVSAEVNPGGEGTAITWYWGAESASGDSVSGTAWVDISKALTGLTENTIYADSVKAENVNGSVTLGGAFRTLAAPTVITGRVFMVRERIP